MLFPGDCRGEALPAEPTVTTGEAAALSDRLRTDDAVAWSPDGTRVAFRGGNCESIYDACLSVGTVATGGETTVAAYGGGSVQNSGFAVVPSWRSDGAKLTWTAYQMGETAADDQPVHLVEYDAVTGAKRTSAARWTARWRTSTRPAAWPPARTRAAPGSWWSTWPTAPVPRSTRARSPASSRSRVTPPGTPRGRHAGSEPRRFR